MIWYLWVLIIIIVLFILITFIGASMIAREDGYY